MKYIFILWSLMFFTFVGCSDSSQQISSDTEKKSTSNISIRNINIVSAVNVLADQFQSDRIDVKFHENGRTVSKTAKTKKILAKKALLKVKEGTGLKEFIEEINSSFDINGHLDGSDFVIEI